MSQRLASILNRNEIEFLRQCSHVLYAMLFKAVYYNKKTEFN